MIGIEHNYAARVADLRRSQTYARRGVHRLDHAFDEPVEAAIDLFDRLRRILERRIGKFADIQQSHLSWFLRTRAERARERPWKKLSKAWRPRKHGQAIRRRSSLDEAALAQER